MWKLILTKMNSLHGEEVLFILTKAFNLIVKCYPRVNCSESDFDQ